MASIDVVRQSAIMGKLKVIKYFPKTTQNDIPVFMDSIKEMVKQELDKLIKEHWGIKCWLSVDVEYDKPTDIDEQISAHLEARSIVLYNLLDFEKKYNAWSQQVEVFNENYESIGSACRLENILCANLTTSEYRP